MLDGEHFEARSATLLEEAGFRIIVRRYRCRAGELDLVAENGHLLLFVEVRARADSRWGGAAASVDRKKQCKLARCAAHFLNRQPQWKSLSCRFDVIAWDPGASDAGISARWIPAAFTL